MFEGLVSHFEKIFVLLNIPKCNFVDVEKLIFWFWTSPKCDLREVKR